MAERHLHTRQGQHLNFKGKRWLAELIAKEMEVRNRAVTSLSEEEPPPPGTILSSGNFPPLPQYQHP
jgi:hypothetical protein